MAFEEMIEQTLAMLRRHKRLTYRALRRQFNLDETYLADLTDAILYAYPQVVEEDGRDLVWTDVAPCGEGSGSRLDAVLPELIGLLQRRGRVTYRTLTQIFGLDEMLLHELRKELLFQRLAVDEDGKGLVWAAAVPFLAPSLRSPVAPLPEASLPAGSVEASRPVRSTPEAERRQVTVPAFPDGPSRGPRPRRTLQSSASPILLCLSRPRMAAPRLAARRCLVYTALRIIHPWRSR